MRSTLRLWTILLLSVGCGDSTAPAPEPEPEPEPEVVPFSFLITGDGQADTVTAQLVQALMVELRDTLGDPVVGETVRFDALSVGFTPTVLVAGLSDPLFRIFAADSTDQSGRAGVVVRLGTLAGPGGVIVTVPRRGLVDTAAFTILPGRPAFIAAEPEDTALSLTGSFPLRVRVTDRFQNPRQETVTFSAVDPVASVSPAGVVAAQSVGRGRVIAQSGALRDTSWVSVVPAGMFAASAWDRVVVSGFDGSGRQAFALPTSNGGYYPSWSSSTDLVVTSGSRITHIQIPSGTVEDMSTTNDSGLVEEVWPAATRDGSWIYFAGTKSYASMQVWRVASGGGVLERVSPDPPYVGDTWPAPSPDGSRMAFVTFRGTGGTELAVMEVATRSVTTLNLYANAPRWAPQSDRIAYVRDGTMEIWVADADGSEAHRVSPAGRNYSQGVDWSADEQWLLASEWGVGICLVNLTTGVVLPIPGTADLAQPVWRP